MNSNKDIFTRVNTPEERDKIFNEICLSKTTVLGKVASPLADLVLLQGEVYTRHELVLNILDKVTLLPDSGEIVLKAVIGDRNYLYSGPYRKRDHSLLVPTDRDLYHVQRRDDFRLRLPSGYKVHFNLTKTNLLPQQVKFEVFDMSGGGCRILASQKQHSFQVGDVLEGEIQLPDRPAIAVRAEVRHLQLVGEKDSAPQGIGLMFVGLTPQVKNKLAALVLDLYRQLYSRLS